ncbi:hypothetical protein, partial [Limnospira sp. PMC 1223.20]|uniref:hypothetical protein n=1 Tax=Limnospira sp. PMC 1223.20 TaxID=2981021 RepID=UPI0028E0CFDE
MNDRSATIDLFAPEEFGGNAMLLRLEAVEADAIVGAPTTFSVFARPTEAMIDDGADGPSADADSDHQQAERSDSQQQGREPLVSRGISQEIAQRSAFAALRDDGEIITWGNPNGGGDSSAVSDLLQGNVASVTPSSSAFAALTNDGAVVFWGDPRQQQDFEAVADQLQSNIVSISSTTDGFAVLNSEGGVVSWGMSAVVTTPVEDPDDDIQFGGIDLVIRRGFEEVEEQLQSGVIEIFNNQFAFAALKDDGSVVTWGLLDSGGNSDIVAQDLESGVEGVYATRSGFAALKNDGSVVVWGQGGPATVED